MKQIKVELIVGIAVLMGTLSGCSHKATYDNIQLHNRNKCAQEHPTRFEECIKASSTSFEEYQKEREEVLSKEQ